VRVTTPKGKIGKGLDALNGRIKQHSLRGGVTERGELNFFTVNSIGSAGQQHSLQDFTGQE
jgi:hypothetical protein